VIDFLRIYTEIHAECAMNSLEAALNRLAMHFATLEEEIVDIDQFSDRLLKLAELTFRPASRNDAVAFLTGVLRSGSDSPRSAAIFHLLRVLAQAGIRSFDPIEVLPAFGSLLQPPPLGRYDYLALTAYIGYFVDQYRFVLDPELAQRFFEVTIEHAIFNYPEAQSCQFATLLHSLIRVCPVITATPADVAGLIRTGKDDLVYSAGTLLPRVPKRFGKWRSRRQWGC
jgi:hypothetical protein